VLFLVCRKDGVEGKVRTSELWPTLVEGEPNESAASIVRRALDTMWPGYNPVNKSYYVVPMLEAQLVTFKPKQDYEVVTTPVMQYGDEIGGRRG